MSNILPLFGVALLWGATNPFIRKGSAGIDKIQHESKFKQTLHETIYLFTRWQYLVPFLLNQSGSVLFVFALQSTDLSLAVPVANTLTFVITAIVSHLLGEEAFTKRGLTGMAFMIVGTTICTTSKSISS